MTTTISPSNGQGCLYTQGGPGASPGYAAIDLRRADGAFLSQGPVNTGSYLVSQRGAGANQSVDIAANVGYYAVPGTTVSFQAPYWVAPHNAVINEVIAAADPTNPRIDQVILRCYDNTIDGTGNNFARTEVLTGTPTGGATLANRTGAAALSANAVRLADVLVPAGSTSVTNASIKDRRPKARGKSVIATQEGTASASYVTLATPDQVNEIVLPTDGYIAVLYQANWRGTNNTPANRAAIFLTTAGTATQLKSANAATPAVQEATGPAAINSDEALATYFGGLASSGISAYTGDVTTGQIVGAGTTGGVCYIRAAAGSYDVSVQYKNTGGGTTTAKSRTLDVWTFDPAYGPLA